MTHRTLITNCRPFDSARGTLGPLSTLVVEGDRIVENVAEPRRSEGATVIDAGGRVAVPGLIDAHVHVAAVSHDAWRMAAMPASLITAMSKPILEGMLQRGFTTVRDAAGADFGLQRAVARPVCRSAPAHRRAAADADRRPCRHAPAGRAQEFVCSCAGLGLFGAVADGDAEVRRAGARAGAQRRQPDQDHGRRRRLQPHRPDRRHAVLAGRTGAPSARRPRPPTPT
jgi:adenine deaminase